RPPAPTMAIRLINTPVNHSQTGRHDTRFNPINKNRAAPAFNGTAYPPVLYAAKENARASPGIFSLIQLVSRTSYRRRSSSPLQTRNASSDFDGYLALPAETPSAALSAAWSGSLASPTPLGTSGLQDRHRVPE